ncbi:MAG: hypothetical protein KF784_07655 [Fimbriimonadaceae bacterium]|nr:hypothetical protein [Fimbriimonadaceae bacterium]
MKPLYKAILFALSAFVGITLLPQTRVITLKQIAMVNRPIPPSEQVYEHALWYAENINQVEFDTSTVDGQAAKALANSGTFELGDLLGIIEANPDRSDLKRMFTRLASMPIRTQSQIDKMSEENLAQLKGNASRILLFADEAKTTDPNDGFWFIRKANALWILGRYDEAKEAWIKASECTEYNDGTSEQAKLISEQLRKAGYESADHEAAAYAMVLLPHLSDIRKLSEELPEDSTDDMLATAKIGKLLTIKAPNLITSLVGTILIADMAKPSAKEKPSMTKAEELDSMTSSDIFTWGVKAHKSLSGSTIFPVDEATFERTVVHSRWSSLSFLGLVWGVLFVLLSGRFAQKRSEDFKPYWIMSLWPLTTWPWAVEMMDPTRYMFFWLSLAVWIALVAVISRFSSLHKFEIWIALSVAAVCSLLVGGGFPLAGMVLCFVLIALFRFEPIHKNLRNPILQATVILVATFFAVLVYAGILEGRNFEVIMAQIAGFSFGTFLIWLGASKQAPWNGRAPALAIIFLTIVYLGGSFMEMRVQGQLRAWITDEQVRLAKFRSEIGG